MIKKGSVILSFWQRIWHFSVPFLLLIIPIFATIELYKYYVTHTYVGKIKVENFLWGYLTLIPILGLYYFQKSRLRFKEINCIIDSISFHKSIEETAIQLAWTIEKKANNYIVARSGFSWNSWGELIIIIKDSDRILFNSICDPDNMISIASWGKNKKNRLIFQENLEKNCT